MKENEDIKKTINLIAVYARVSTARQEEEGTIETQLSVVREFAKKNGYTIVKEYIDDGWSGDILARPQLDQLRQDAKSKIWEAVLIYDPDRLARRYSYQELVMDELREAGIEMLFVTTPTPKNGEEKILHGVKGLFAEYERVKIAERFRLGKLRKVKEGHILIGEAPYGLTYIKKQDKKHGYFVINKDEIINLNKIFLMVDEGLTIRAVVKRLRELGIKPRKSRRGVWSTSTLSHLLRNKTYIGEAYFGKSYTVVPDRPFNTEKYRKTRKTSKRLRPENEWISIPVSPIIDRNLFTRVQEQLRMNFELCKRNRKNEYLLAGKMRCICGNRRTGEGPQHGKHLYYRCSARVLSFPLPSQCAEKGINARIVDALVWQRIAKLMSSPELLVEQANRWLKQRHDKRQDVSANVEDIQKEVSKLKEQEDRYNKAYGVGLFPIEKLKEYISQIRERIAVIESQLAKTESGRGGMNGAVMPKPYEVKLFAKKAAETLQNLNFEARRAIVMNVLDKVVGTKKELQVFGYIPIENGKLQTISRHYRPP